MRNKLVEKKVNALTQNDDSMEIIDDKPIISPPIEFSFEIRYEPYELNFNSNELEWYRS